MLKKLLFCVIVHGLVGGKNLLGEQVSRCFTMGGDQCVRQFSSRAAAPVTQPRRAQTPFQNSGKKIGQNCHTAIPIT